MFNVSKFPTGVDFLGTALEFRKRMKNLLLLVYSCMCSPECEIKHFHVVVVQWQQRNVQWKAPRSKLMDELNWKRAWPPVWGTRKKCRTSDFSLAHRNYRTLQRLSIIKMQMCHGEEIYFFKTNSTVSIHTPMHMMLESLENLTLWMAQSCFRPSFIGLWKKNIANGKEACQDDQVQQCKYVCSDVCYHICQKNWCFLLGKTPLISASRFSSFLLCTAITLTRILSFDKIMIQFPHHLYSHVNTGQNVEGQSQHPGPQGWKMSYSFF